jgi:uncharacterized protein (TIRG00374 family)
MAVVMKRSHWRDPKVWIGLAVTAFFLWLAFRKLDWGQTWDAMRRANPGWILLLSLLVLSMLFIRGHRWSLFLKPVKRIPWVPLGWSTCIGFAVNNLLPARLGEVARTLSAARKTGLGFGVIFGTVVVERIYDTLSLLALFALSLFVWDFAGPMARLSAAVREQFGVNVDQRTIAVNLSILIGGLLFAIVMLKWQTDLSLRVAGFFLKPLPARWRERFLAGLRNFINGLTQTTNPLEAVWIVIISAGLWIISIYTVYIGLVGCGIPTTATDSTFIIMSMAIAVSIPASPGYFGTFEFLAATAITLTTNVTWEQAIGAAIVIHLANYAPQTISGLYALAREGLSIREIEQAEPPPR